MNDRSLARDVFQAEPHGLQQGQDVREEDGGVHPEAFRGHQRDFRRELRGLAHIQEIQVGFEFPVGPLVAAGLAEQPYGRILRRFTAASPEEGRFPTGTVRIALEVPPHVGAMPVGGVHASVHGGALLVDQIARQARHAGNECFASRSVGLEVDRKTMASPDIRAGWPGRAHGDLPDGIQQDVDPAGSGRPAE